MCIRDSSYFKSFGLPNVYLIFWNKDGASGLKIWTNWKWTLKSECPKVLWSSSQLQNLKEQLRNVQILCVNLGPSCRSDAVVVVFNDFWLCRMLTERCVLYSIFTWRHGGYVGVVSFCFGWKTQSLITWVKIFYVVIWRNQVGSGYFIHLQYYATPIRKYFIREVQRVF